MTHQTIQAMAMASMVTSTSPMSSKMRISILTHLSRGAIAYRGVRRKEKVGGPVSVPLEQLPDEEQHECPRSKRLGCLLGRFFVRHINHVGAVAHCFDTGGNNVVQGGKAMTRL